MCQYAKQFNPISPWNAVMSIAIHILVSTHFVWDSWSQSQGSGQYSYYYFTFNWCTKQNILKNRLNQNETRVLQGAQFAPVLFASPNTIASGSFKTNWVQPARPNVRLQSVLKLISSWFDSELQCPFPFIIYHQGRHFFLILFLLYDFIWKVWYQLKSLALSMCLRWQVRWVYSLFNANNWPARLNRFNFIRIFIPSSILQIIINCVYPHVVRWICLDKYSST